MGLDMHKKTLGELDLLRLDENAQYNTSKIETTLSSMFGGLHIPSGMPARADDTIILLEQG